MSFWRKLASWAAGMEERSNRSREVKQANRLTKAGFQNRLDAFLGQLNKIRELDAHMLIQRTDEILVKYSKDVVTSLRDFLVLRMEQTQEWWSTSFKLLETSLYDTLRGTLGEFGQNMEDCFTETDRRAAKRTNVIINHLLELKNSDGGVTDQHIRGLVHMLHTMDINDTNRYLEVMERIRLLDLKQEERYNILGKTNVALYEHLAELFTRMSAEPEQRGPEPSLEWLADNVDNLIEFAKSMTTLRENHAPPDQAMVAVVKAVRVMLPDVSMLAAKEAFDNQLLEWGLAA